MVNPGSVELIIFDLDGTILESGRAVYHAVRNALPKIGFNADFDKVDIEKLLAMSAEQFYRGILPDGKKSLWQEARNAIHREYDDALAQYASAYPGTAEALDVLKQRGYTLALYSYSHSDYIKTALDIMGIANCFDYVESVQDTNTNKIELVRKIKRELGCNSIAVVGDSINDVNAAVQNNGLSVGALYGYGGLVEEQADVAIISFADLLEVFV